MSVFSNHVAMLPFFICCDAGQFYFIETQSLTTVQATAGKLPFNLLEETLSKARLI